jgi:hypothetical protein
MLAMANQNGCVFGSLPGLANRARVPLDSVEKAIGKFLGPDPYSRSPEFDGRRIEPIDGGWRLLTYSKHRAIRQEEDRREYMKGYMRDYRKQSVNNVSNVSHSKPVLAKAEAEAEADKSKVKNKSAHFVRPSLEEVAQYVSSRGDKISPEAWMDFYESKGWKIGRDPMKDWKSSVRTWERRIQEGKSDGKSPLTETFAERDSRSTIEAARRIAARLASAGNHVAEDREAVLGRENAAVQQRLKQLPGRGD